MEQPPNHHELIIIGSGPAGLTAGLYAARANLNPLILNGILPGGQLMGTTFVENWPGNKSILGPTLMLNMQEHAAHFGAQFLDESITHVNFKVSPFELFTDKTTKLTAHAVIIATGASPKRLNCLGEAEHWGKGVSTCAVCDGPFYKDKKIIIVGGGDTAMEDASFMLNYSKDITVVHILDTLTASAATQKKVIDNPNIKIIYQTTVTEIKGNGTNVTGATLINQTTQEITSLDAEGIFVAIGLNPNVQPFKGEVAFNSQGFIQIENNTRTSVPGIFAAGDVADYKYRQAITSAGAGCMAALDAERYLKNL